MADNLFGKQQKHNSNKYVNNYDKVKWNKDKVEEKDEIRRK